MTALLVFSHLRWNFVFQRPQQLMTRLAQRYPVYFIEEPVPGEHPRLVRSTVAPGVEVLVPHCPGAGGFDGCCGHVRALVRDLLAAEPIDDYLAWFYTPMAVGQLDGLAPRAVVYDCMDELSAFKGAPPGLLDRERQLFAEADLVFTGGPSLYEAKRRQHARVHCFPSSVDRAHFATARTAGEHPDTRHLDHPRLGFFGVLDERLDVDLLAHVADSRPDWTLVAVGPTVKIDPATLPRRPNLHYLGPRQYAELPAFLAGWDVCLLPFALNEATRYISPTKTLEYMAAEKPIVSTAVRDVATLYGNAVLIARDFAEFVDHCEKLLAEREAERALRLTRMRQVLDDTSWHDTASRMAGLIDQHLRQAARSPESGRSRPLRAPVVVIGAGPTGLSAAYHLGRDALLLEQADAVGGLCRSVFREGFVFDQAGHIMFSNDPGVHELYRRLLGDNVHWQDREAWIYTEGVHTRYPFQGALHGLPPDVLKECILGAIEARYGKAGVVADATPRPDGDCCADGTDAIPRGNPACTARSRNFADFIQETWGAGIARHFALPYNRKLWACDLTDIETSWLEGRVPLPDLEAILDGALRPVPAPQGPNARFGYPLRGGFSALMDGFLPLLGGPLELGARVTRVMPHRRELLLDDGRSVHYDLLVSTMPLPALVGCVGNEAPATVRAAAAALRRVSVRCVNLGIGRAALTNKHWIYYAGDTVFHRVFLQGNASPHCNPPGGFGLTCEISYSPEKPLPCEGDALVDLCIRDCIRVGLFTDADPVLVRHTVDIPTAYVVYDHARAANVALIRAWLRDQGILIAGRYSEWEYYNSDHAFLAGRRAAETARTLLGERRRTRHGAPGISGGTRVPLPAAGLPSAP